MNAQKMAVLNRLKTLTQTYSARPIQICCAGGQVRIRTKKSARLKMKNPYASGINFLRDIRATIAAKSALAIDIATSVTVNIQGNVSSRLLAAMLSRIGRMM